MVEPSVRRAAPRRSAERRLALALSLLLVAAVVCFGVATRPSAEEPSRSFQRIVHGFGLGPALDLRACPSAVDPRLGSGCRWSAGPFPGGRRLCPRHGAAIVTLDPLRPRHG